MGVDLSGIIPRTEIDFNYLRNKIVGVDAFNTLYQFLSSIRGQDGNYLMDSKGKVTSHLQGLFSRSLNLMSKGIRLVFVFDGKPPELKFKENEERTSRKVFAEQKYREAANEDNFEEMYKYSKQFIRLNQDMIDESKALISALGLPYIQAPSEAEGQIAYMCKKKVIDFAASQDYDALLFGSPKLVRNLTLSQKRKVRGGKTVFTFLELIELDKVLKELNLTHDQLVVLGILIGTDFNGGGVKGIGPKKALKLVQNYKSINQFDKMFAELNIDFDWRKVYDIFVNLPFEEKFDLKWKKVDEIAVRKLLVDEHDFNLERINSLLDKYKEENKNSNQKGLSDFF
ncbi:flap endonuclease-1 [Candidatus Woesearchaeota archaeon]|nr:flap endonuclease-1 [Candidatus Woesearchaeota archaeon]